MIVVLIKTRKEWKIPTLRHPRLTAAVKKTITQRVCIIFPLCFTYHVPSNSVNSSCNADTAQWASLLSGGSDTEDDEEEMGLSSPRGSTNGRSTFSGDLEEILGLSKISPAGSTSNDHNCSAKEQEADKENTPVKDGQQKQSTPKQETGGEGQKKVWVQ